MRLVLVAVVGLASPAFAGGHSGGGGGSGPLGQVSGGLATATASSASSGGYGGSSGDYVERDAGSDPREVCNRYRAAVVRIPGYRDVVVERECRSYWRASVRRVGGNDPQGPAASVTAFAGAEKVVGSNGSLSVALSVVDERLRLNGSFTQYYENEMSGARITMMAPELSLGVHLGPDGPTRVWLEGGAMYLKTDDPAGNSSVAGPTIGARIEHQMSPDLAFAGVVEGAYLADGVRGVAGRVGVRFHHVEAAFRVLDLNVGPALYGPEVGVGF